MKNVSILLFVLLLCGCKSDDSTTEDSINPVVSTSDFMATIEENPEQGQLIGMIEGTTNIGTLTYTFDEQSEPGALALDIDTGDLTVSDTSYFDFEENEEITATVIVSNGELEQNSFVTIEILDVFRENDLRLTEVHFSANPQYTIASTFCDVRNVINYENDLFVSFLVNYYEQAGVYARIRHDGNNITEYFHIMAFDGGSQTQRTLTFTYNAENRIESIHRFVECYGNAPCPVIDEDYSVIYNGNSIEIINIDTNVVKKIIMNDEGAPLRYEYTDTYVDFAYDNNGNLISKTDQDGNQFTYTYDTKRNPYSDIDILNWNEVQNIFFTMSRESYQYEYFKIFNHGIWTNKNNIAEVDASQCDSLCVRSNRYLYDYNSDGYPTSKTFEEFPSEMLLYQYD